MTISETDTNETPNYDLPPSYQQDIWMWIAIGSLCMLTAGGAAFLCWFKRQATSSIDFKGQNKVQPSTQHSQTSISLPLTLMLDGNIPIPLGNEFNKLLGNQLKLVIT